MYFLNKKKYFETLTEAKLELISQISASLMEMGDKHHLIELIKISLEQHDNKPTFLELIEKNISDENSHYIQETLEAIKRSSLIIFPAAFINTHATLGAAESFFPPELLKNPTAKMIEARDNISKSILATLKQYKTQGFTTGYRDMTPHFENFARGMIFESARTYPGLFSLTEINLDLPEDKKIFVGKRLTSFQIMHVLDKTIKKLETFSIAHYQIMAIHTQFAFSLLKRTVMSVQDNHYTAENNPAYTKIVRAYNKINYSNKTINDFMRLLRNPEKEFDEVRAFISDKMMYLSGLYQVEKSRGRGSPDQKIKTTQLGVMRNNNPGMRALLLELEKDHPEWVDWSRCPFESESKIVNSMTSQETPFIASFSGTTSLLINLMLSGNPITLEEQQSYLCSILSYISSIGFHSIHEILAPAAFCMDIIPRKRYPVKVPTHAENYLPPRYYGFYQTIEKFDPEFAERREQGWNRLIQWYQQVYKIQHSAPQAEQVLKYVLEHDINEVDLELLSDLCYEAINHSMSYENKLKLFKFIQTNIKEPESLIRFRPCFIFMLKELKISNLKIICNDYLNHLKEEIKKEDKPENLIKLNDRKNIATNLLLILNPEDTPDLQLYNFQKLFLENRNKLEGNRNSAINKFLKLIVHILSLGITYKIGMFRTREENIDECLNPTQPFTCRP